jgi:hypothetical protein
MVFQTGIGGTGATANGNNGDIIFKSSTTEIARFNNTAGSVGNFRLTSDNQKIILGTGQDAEIYYDGTNLVFNTNATGTGVGYFSDQVSATGYITRTDVFDSSKSAITALDSIKSSDKYITTKGEINHSAFDYSYVTYNITDFTKPVNITIEIDECFLNESKEEECIVTLRNNTIYPYNKVEEGINVVKEVALLKQALYELKQKNTIIEQENNLIKSELCKKDNTYIVYVDEKDQNNIDCKLLSGTNKEKSCYAFFGLPKEDIEINNEPLETGMITMNDIYHLQIKSDLGSQNVITSDSIDNILEVIPITPSPLSFIFYSPQTPIKYLLGQNTLQTIKIELTDNKNRPVDLNLIPFMINIKIEVVKNDDYDIPTGFDPRSINLDNNPAEQTALERIYQDPRIIDRPSPYNVNDYIEYQIIQQMLKDLSKSKRKLKK